MLTVVLAQGLNQTANIIKGFAIAIGIAIAIGFVWQWWVHRQRERQHDLSARARAAYSSFLRLAIQHPEMSEPMLGSIDSPVEMIRYKQFIASLLSMADEVMMFDPSPEWQNALTRQLAPHRSYLASEEFRSGVFADCTAPVKGLIQRVSQGT